MSLGEKSGIVIFIAGILYTVLGFNMDRATIGNPVEPMIFPVILGGALALCGIALYFMQLRKRLVRTEKKAEKGLVWDFQTKMILFICVVSVLYGVLFEKFGYVLSTTLFLSSLLVVFHSGKKILFSVVFALIFSAAIYYCFSEVLSIPLPKMPYFNI